MVFAFQPLQPLIDAFEFLLKDIFHEGLGFGWGFSIVFMTLVVRVALLPLTLKQFKSMQALGRLQPEMKKLQEKYKGDKERLNQEMMKFYRENKVNPAASCLPIVAQLPVFLALFYMLRKDLRLDICPGINPPGTANPRPCGETADSGFLFIPDLTNKATGIVLVALIVLYVGTQLASSIMSTVSMDRNQRLLMLGLPFFFVIFIFNFPAGLLVYWITTNAWTIVQQAIVKKRLGPLRPPPKEGEAPQGLGLAALLGRSDDAATAPSARADSKPKVPAAVAGGAPKGRPSGPPPPSPRKKKKRSGRRR